MYRHRNKFLIGALALAASLGVLLPSTAFADSPHTSNPPAPAPAMSIQALPNLTKTIAGEPLMYPNTPNPVIEPEVLTIQPHGVTPWMIHPVPAYLYVLQGSLTVQFVNGKQETFHAGQDFLQCNTVWHRGVNDTQQPVRFLAVFMGAKGVPTILHPPATN